MLQYLLKRLGLAFVTMVLAMTFLAMLIHIVPGDPVSTILGPRASESLAQTVREEMGLDDPTPEQVYDFIIGAFQGDLGRDFVTRRPVTELIGDALPHTLALAGSGLGLAVLLGIPLGVFSATRPGTFVDRITAVFSVSLVTTPSYVAGLLLLLLFSLKLGLFPAFGTGDFSQPIEYLKTLVLPAVSIAIVWVGYLARLVRSSMLEESNENYVRTAYAFGLRDRVIYYKYMLKNALIPTVAVLGIGLGDLMAGAIFAEVIFSRPGLGRLILDAISTRNYPIVQGGVLTIGLLFIFANLLADLSYRLLDPRIRIEKGTVE